MTPQVDLHALANTGGFGSAQKILKKAGLWDEYAGNERREYRVKVSYEIRHDATETVCVQARCGAEAESLACDAIEDAHDYDVEINSILVLE